jgi:hypothetical protein
MNEVQALPSSVTVSSVGVCALYSEIWRLEQLAEALVDRIQSASARRIARQIRAGLAEIDVEIVDYAGRPYDPGMVPEVLDVQLVDGTADVGDIVSETIEPTLVWGGQVLRRGQIVVRRVVLPGGDGGEKQ